MDVTEKTVTGENTEKTGVAGTGADAAAGTPALTSNVLDCALVIEGGGMRGAYTAGIINALLENEIYFDFVSGISAGSSNLVNYLSRDRSRVKRSFCDLDHGTEPAGGLKTLLQGKGYFNADYFYDGCVRDGSLPFDWETFAANPARFAIQAFERDTGRSVVYGREQTKSLGDLLRYVRASSTLPGFMRPITIDGQVMYDGGMGDGAGISVHLAEQAGYNKFFVICTQPAGYRKDPVPAGVHVYYKRTFAKYPYLRNALYTRPARYNAQMQLLDELTEKGQALVVRPEVMPVKNTTLDSKKLEETYEMGHAQALREMPRWREFLGL